MTGAKTSGISGALLLTWCAACASFIVVSWLMHLGAFAHADYAVAQWGIQSQLGSAVRVIGHANGMPIIAFDQAAAPRLQWLWPLGLLIEWGLVSPIAVSGLAAIALVCSVRLPRAGGWSPVKRLWWQEAAVLGLIAATLMAGTLFLPQVFDRGRATGSILSYPDMFVASGVGFYGFLIMRLWKRPKRYLRAQLLIGIAVLAVTTIILPLYYRQFWLSDVVGGMTLGGAILLGCELLYRSKAR